MNKMYEKYGDLLINKCLCVKKDQPLLITAPIECIEFVRVLARISYKSGIKDIYFDFNDEILKHDALKNLNKEDFKNNNLFNKKIYDEYAKKNAAFLMLYGDNPDGLIDIDDELIAESAKISRNSRPLYKKLQLNNEIAWCIASVATLEWSKKVFPDSKEPLSDMWNLIFKITLVNKKDPIKEWDNKIKNNTELLNKLNKLKIKTLHYKNKLGTDFKISFNDNKWCGSATKIKDGRTCIVNMPTEEVFTSPNKYTANGIVYASMPLVYNSSVINNFYIEFKDGKVINFDAKEGKEVLKSIIEIKNGNYLGEVALVDKNSPIAKSNILFYETLYDENASCHLALGDGFPECINNNKTPKEIGLNESKTHVDFMIGTPDLEIIAETKNSKVTIMKNGKFVI